MIIGYSVIYVNDDITIKDALWGKRVVYSNWEESLKKGREKAEEEVNNWGEDTYIVSLCNSDSKKICESNGDAHIFTIKDKRIGNIGEIYIVPIYNE